MTRQEPDAFGDAASQGLGNVQLRVNIRRATETIRQRRDAAVAERPDWEELREAGRRIKAGAMARLDEHLLELERSLTAAGANVHWAVGGSEANSVVAEIVREAGARRVLKVKSMLAEEIGLNDALEAVGIQVLETDLAELVVQLAGDRPSHLLVPAIHRSRSEIRDLFAAAFPGEEALDDDPRALVAAARRRLREAFLTTDVAITGANFAVAETGTLCIVESEGNGRMCTTLPRVLISVVGIEKVVPCLEDLGVLLQLLARSATGERMSPYTTMWTGVTPGDGPEQVHVVLVDAGRTKVLRDRVGRQALHCIRCSACVNVCPVYEQVGGHAYGTPYAGPIGAILAPQLSGFERGTSLPWATTLCGACRDVCPVKIDIPSVLVHLRARINDRRNERGPERLTMGAARRLLERPGWLLIAERIAGVMGRWRADRGMIDRLPLGLAGGWFGSRAMKAPAAEPFRLWWRRRNAARSHDD